MMFTVFRLKWDPELNATRVVDRETREFKAAAQILASVWSRSGEFSAQVEEGDLTECPMFAAEGWVKGSKMF